MKFPDKKDPKLAEFIGILLGDGCLRKDRVQITLNKEDDKEYTLFIAKLIFDLFEFESKIVARKYDNANDIMIYQKDIINFLLSCGLVYAPKWNRAIVPELYLDSLGKFILRGYFDTDGCVVSMKRTDRKNRKIYPRLEMKFSPAPMQSQFLDLLCKFGFNFCAYPIDNRGRLHVRLNGISELKKWFCVIGSSNPKHLQKVRKWQ